MNEHELDEFSALLSGIAKYYRQPLAPEALRIYWNALREIELSTLRELLSEHVKTSRFLPTVAEILDLVRVTDGRPNPEEAWAMVARSLNDEGVTIVWTEEMAAAFGVSLGLQEDRVAARMAFKETYVKSVQDNRGQGKPVKWTPSLGHDAAGREGPILAAVAAGRITQDHAAKLLPYRDQPSPQVAALIDSRTKRVTDQSASAPMPPHVRAALDKFKPKTIES